jgi:hypothetical protein
MFRYQTRIRVRLLYNTDTYNYIELYHFFKCLSVSTCQYCIRYPCLCPCSYVKTKLFLSIINLSFFQIILTRLAHEINMELKDFSVKETQFSVRKISCDFKGWISKMAPISYLLPYHLHTSSYSHRSLHFYKYHISKPSLTLSSS